MYRVWFTIYPGYLILTKEEVLEYISQLGLPHKLEEISIDT